MKKEKRTYGDTVEAVPNEQEAKKAAVKQPKKDNIELVETWCPREGLCLRPKKQ